MPLQKQSIPISFAKGLDLKTDPYQVAAGNFLALNNSVFTTTGRLTKRNGFSNTTNVPVTTQTTLTTLNDSLVATGSNLYGYSEDTNTWINQGLVQPVQLSTLPLIRVSTSQESPDTALAPNGLILLTYVDNSIAYYQVSDSVTGQQIVKRTALPSTATNPRVFIVGSYFIVTFIANIVSTPTLQYIAIPFATPASPNNSAALGAASSLTAGYDGYVYENTLYYSYSGAGTINLNSLSNSLTTGVDIAIATDSATLISVTVDTVGNYIWITYYNGTSRNAYTTAYTLSFAVYSPLFLVFASRTVSELTSAVTNGINTIFWEQVNFYTYDDSTSNPIQTDFISSIGIAAPGVVVNNVKVILRSVGLASKPFIQYVYTLNSNPLLNITSNMLPIPGTYTLISQTVYMLAAYGCIHQVNSLDNSNQPSYFLIDSSGNIYMRLAYSNGGGYATSQVLPSVSYSNGNYYIPYQYADFLTTVNKGTNLALGTPSNAIYTQYGINLATISINSQNQYSSEIASALHLTGGMLWEYDGVKPVEHGFHVWPENILATAEEVTGGGVSPQQYFYQFTYEWTDNAGNLHRSAPSIPVTCTAVAGSLNFTATFTSGASTITVTSASGLFVGQVITDTTTPGNLQAGTYITSISGTTIGISLPTLGAGTGNTLNTIDTSVNVIDVPTLRLTYKQPFLAPTNTLVTNPVRIVGYRWSTAQQVYYQFTSVTLPYKNDTTIDSIEIDDSLNDKAILGNAILYTTGGVVEDIAAPASIASALFNNRLFLIDAEDRNLLWFSKQVIEAVPVEMSDLLTLYVAPTSGAQGSTGPMTALSAMDDKLIIFKKDAIYYINGTGPDNTGANSTFSDPIFITATVGCSNPASVVLMPNGVMFQSDKGIWLLGRDLSTTYIGAPVEQYNSSTVMSATAIPGTNQVRFVLNGSVTLMYDYFVHQWATHSNISAISATLWQSSLTYLNSNGSVFQETPNTYIDGSEPVLMSLTTSWISLAGLQGYERFYFGNLLGTYFTPFTLDVTLAYDYNSSATQNITVSPNNYAKSWGEDSVYGSTNYWGGSEGNVFSARIFPEKQKCQTFQVTINEVYDPTFGVLPGEGLSLSGLALIAGMKRGFRTQSAVKSFG